MDPLTNEEVQEVEEIKAFLASDINIEDEFKEFPCSGDLGPLL